MVTAVLILGVGIGMATAMWTVFKRIAGPLWVRGRPYPDRTS